MVLECVLLEHQEIEDLGNSHILSFGTRAFLNKMTEKLT
jgi:hypothetical protein